MVVYRRAPWTPNRDQICILSPQGDMDLRNTQEAERQDRGGTQCEGRLSWPDTFVLFTIWDFDSNWEFT